MAEVIKHGIISNQKYFDFLNNKSKQINDLNFDIILEMIYDSVAYKVKIVEQDEKEGGLRKILNFGHTIGHAFEEVIGYNIISHGFAVAIGMNAAAYLSLKRNMINEELFNSIQKLILKFKLPLFLSDLKLDANPEKLFSFLYKDKKAENQQIVFILIGGIGNPQIIKNLNKKEIMEAIQYVIKDSSMH